MNQCYIAVTGYDVYQNSSLLGSTSATSYSVSGLSVSTAYTFVVKAKDAAGNVSAASNTVSVTTLSNSVNYCSAAANNRADEIIGNVKFNTINNTSTETAWYEDFTTLSTNFNRGTTYSISITPFWSATKYKEAYAVYIDYNGNGVFNDAGEKVWTKAGSTTSPVTGSVKIPATAKAGSTRMRVMMKYSTTPSFPCGNYTYGQVEDYTINIMETGKDARVDVNAQRELSIYPNPVAGSVLNISNNETDDFRIFDMSGKLITAGAFKGNAVNVGNLPKGVYIIQIGKVSKRFIKE